MEWKEPIPFFQLPRPPNISEFQEKHLQDGKMRELSNVSEQSLVLRDINGMISIPLKDSTISKNNLLNLKTTLNTLKAQEKKEECVIAEFLHEHKQMILNVRSSPCKNNIQNLRLSRTLGAGLISKGKVFSSYSKEQLKEITGQLWYPIETDLQDSDSNYSNGSLSIIESNSWFSTRALEVKNPNFVKTCCPSSTYFPVEPMAQDGIGRKKLKVKKKKRAKIKFVTCCEFAVTKRIDDKVYGRLCGNILINNEVVCPKHKGKRQAECEEYWAYTCEAIIPKCGTGIIPERSKKGIKCGEFCKEKDLYCKTHIKTASKCKNPIIRCIKVRARPTFEQKRILEKWFGDKRRTVNLMVNERLENEFNGSVSISDKKEREAYFKKKYITKCDKYLRKTPKDIRSNAIEEYFTGVSNAFNRYIIKQQREQWKQSNFQNYIPKYIKRPVMKFQKKGEQQCITIPSKNTSIKILETKLGSKNPQIGIKLYPTFMSGPIVLDRRSQRNKTLQDIISKNIQYDYKLLKTKSGKYYFCFPYSAEVKPNNSTKQAALDGGVRNFQTVYSPQGEVEQHGYHVSEIIRIYQMSINSFKQQYFKGSLKYNEKLRIRRVLLQEKLRNMINDLHLKTANSLCKKYGTIILPHYGTLSMIRSNSISPYTKRETLALSHAEFRKRLISKAELRACTVLIPKNEYKTTLTCGICFSENYNVGESEIFHCPKCNLTAGRDVNAPRNIFIRQLVL